MGERGPAPEPTRLKKLKGNPGKRALNDREPQLGPAIPPVPPGLVLDDLAQQQWDELSELLLSMRVITEADGLVLASLCQTYSRWVQASKQLEQSGLIFRTKSGYIQQSPLLGVVNTCIDMINRLSRELGLSPSARTRVHAVEEPPPKSDLARLLEMAG